MLNTDTFKENLLNYAKLYNTISTIGCAIVLVVVMVFGTKCFMYIKYIIPALIVSISSGVTFTRYRKYYKTRPSEYDNTASEKIRHRVISEILLESILFISIAAYMVVSN